MSQIKPLKAHKLRSYCDTAEFEFTTTKDLPNFEGMVGQDRASDALSFGIKMDKPGYNMYLMGSKGLGKHTLLKEYLDNASTEHSAASDCCYVFNFDEPNKPKVIQLQAGDAGSFLLDMQQFLRELDNTFSAIFAKEDNTSRLNQAEVAVDNLTQQLEKKYSNTTDVIAYLRSVKADLINTLATYCDVDEADLKYEECFEVLGFQNYEPNIIVKQSSAKHAPVIIEDNPSISNLFGKIEFVSQMGSLETDFHNIKAGSLHQANGGYLIIDADKLLDNAEVWKKVKQALINNEIEIPSSNIREGNVHIVSMEPKAISLSLKLILVGSRSLYNQLVDNDDDFEELFKVEVDFSDTIECTKKSLNQYAQVIATLIRKHKLTDFNQAAVKTVIEYSMRQIEDSTQLSTHMHSILELLIESDYWARIEKKKIVRDVDVKTAIEKQIYRADRSRENAYNDIKKGNILIDVSGEKVGAINGLFVIESGRLEFAQPARITANVRIGDGDVVDIEREVDLGGPLHSKGVLILTSYLGSRYATGKPLSFSSSLVFEQSYGSVDGDSATVGELCTLLSAISKIPVKQSLAITGSADQHGNVQAIGGTNEKIEGFYDICKLKGLTGKQGVIMPAVNIPHLILRDDVIAAIENEQFYLYPIDTVDDAISLLTGLPAGERNASGGYPEGTVNYKVEQCLLELAELKHDDHHKDEDHDGEKETKDNSENSK